MKRILIRGAVGASLCLADSWSGKLVDADCVTRQKAEDQQQNACAPSRSTTMFAVEMQDGRTMRLDSTGNAKAAEMMHNSDGSRAVMVTVTGTQNGRTVRVESIEMK